MRIGDNVVVLDVPFLLEAVTTGLYWRVSDHVRMSYPEAWRPWSAAYAEMIEALAEELVEVLAPTLLDRSSAFFTEEDIKASFATKKRTPPNMAGSRSARGRPELDLAPRRGEPLLVFVAATAADENEPLSGVDIAGTAGSDGTLDTCLP